MSTLDILREDEKDRVLLHCSGRLDATSVDHLTDYMDRLVREGKYQVALDLSGINYLSSAGIRALVVQHKNLQSLNGYFTITKSSENVAQVLDMVGMSGMFSQLDHKACPAKEAIKDIITREEGYVFRMQELDKQASTTVICSGEPERIAAGNYTREDTRTITPARGKFALGLGAIGESFPECSGRFGEYLFLNGMAAYLPADASKKPDYMINHRKLIARFTEVYGLHFSGPFSHRVVFEPGQEASTLELSSLARLISRLTGYRNWAFVMIAQSAGLIGTSLNVSPVDGRALFSYPGVKDAVRFTTEPAHLRMQTISAGIVSKAPAPAVAPGAAEVAVAPGETGTPCRNFLRPMKDNTLLAHIHTAVFPYIPLKKHDLSPDDTINHLLDDAGLADILHLLCDDRPLSGLGESAFRQGMCWVVPVEKFVKDR